ncbi:MAG: pentapeptide repeat-containing protein [Euryarchaeota archaeon]|nr:pentapeptide repeat-containing protein [Euryarchaeota archaeon]
MARCKYKFQGAYYNFMCPFEVEEGSEYCFWHQEIEEKRPSKEQLNLLKENEIIGVFLSKVNFNFADLRGINLILANLKGSSFYKANLKKANLNSANLQDSDLKEANLENAYLPRADLQGAEFFRTNLKGACLIFARLENYSLTTVNFQNADLEYANLTNSDLSDTNLSKASLKYATLENANLRGCKLIEANLFYANLSKSDLAGSDLSGADLSYADIRQASLVGTIFDSKSILEGTRLIGSNISSSYVDETKTFRNATFFNSTEIDEKEINEFVADTLSTKRPFPYILSKQIMFDVSKIEYLESDFTFILNALNEAEIIRHIGYGKALNIFKVIFYKDLVDAHQKGEISYEIKEKFDDLVFYKKPKENIHLWDKIPLLKNYMIAIAYEDFLFDDKKESFFEFETFLSSHRKELLYESSFEIYTKLYNFYSSNGDSLQAKHAHYRANESYRKLLLTKGGFKNIIRARVFDGFILKVLAGHGDQIWNPIFTSMIGIILFAFCFWKINGIIVQGREVKLIDYLYFSLTTFTGYSFPNIQPDISIPLMQPLVMGETVFGLMMVSLIIFVVTYQISR